MMGTFTCFGCGNRVSLAEYASHKAACAKFGQRNFVPDEPEQEVKAIPEKPKEGIMRWL